MEEDLGEIFRSIRVIEDAQKMDEKEYDIGQDNEDYIVNLVTTENEIVNAGLSSRLPSRIMHHAWLLRVRNTAISNIVRVN
ncbi:hypothetical protein FXO38_08348 [Capsicum annuum]|uniref:Uncharacterized protein n=1 Tax=Capsicum annuum TaxID=4072 RepID=A0A2G2ZQK4_CAPAN|nr:hypothetical protein FXO37_20934 [Capsicum annuum]KAF3667901.1 hypothetical protein FXO38_08348 [Capsicum annuum]PHT84235.1 hypothetical protein T459_12678 [Capsicum annuum]